MTVSAIFAGALTLLRTGSASPILAAPVRELRLRSASAVFSAPVVWLAPGSALSAPAQHPVGTFPTIALSHPAQHSVSAVPSTALSQPSQHEVSWKPGRAAGSVHDHWTSTGFHPDTGPVFDHNAGAIPGISAGTIFDHPVEVKVAGIPGKQIATGARGIATANIVDDAVTSAKLAADAVDATALAAAAFGDGLTGGGGTAVSVQPVANKGIAVGASGVAIDEANGSVALSPAGVWTFPADGLQVNTTPDSANDAVNKAYVDNNLAGLTWLDPVTCVCLVGNLTVASINALGDLADPADSRVYVVTDAGTLTQGSLLVAAGDIVQWDDNNTQWIKIVTNSGGFPPAGTRFTLATGVALIAPYTDATDDGKVAEFDGASLTATTLTSPNNGDAVLVTAVPGETAPVLVNQAFTYSGTVPTGSWVQFSGGGSFNAGDGLSLSGNTLNVGAGNGISVAADTVAVNADGTSGGNIQPVNVVANGVGVDVNAIAGTGLEADGSANLRVAAQGNGLTGGAGSTLSVQPNNTDGGGVSGIEVAANGVRIDATAAGNGLTGGDGAALSVLKDVSGSASAQADAVALNVASTGLGIDGDKVEIDWAAANYTPTDVAETDDAGQLSAHLKGIDLALASAGGAPTPLDKNLQPAATTGDAQDSTINITSTPQSDSYVAVLVNGIQVYLADDNTERTTADCYFSADGGTTARAIEDIAAADSLYWNGAQAGYDLDTNDVVDLNYNV